MSRHDASNTNCDKNAYPGAEGVLCTCDVDPADDRPAPSTVLPAASPILGSDPRWVPGQVTLSGSHAAAYVELQAATRELEAARSMLKPAEQRWRAALDRFHAEMLR
jgi:hypothetical protein